MTPIVENLQIKSFRGLKDLNLAGLGWVNILVGKNNSGKTTILEALSIACNPLDLFQWVGTSERRLSIGRTPVAMRPSLESIKWLFPQERQDPNHQGKDFNITHGNLDSGKIKINFSGHLNVSIVAEINEVSDIYIDGKDRDDGSLDSEDEEILQTEYERSGILLDVSAQTSSPSVSYDARNQNLTVSLWEEERFIQSKKTKGNPFFNNVTVYPSYSSLDIAVAIRFTRIAKEGEKNNLIQLLQLFDPGIADIYILNSSPKTSSLYIEHQKLGLAPFYTFGDGLKKAILIALALPLAKDGILLIDEIETSIHYSALSQVFTWLIRACNINKTQLFVTTHSLEAVDAMLEAESEKDEIVAFRLNDEGKPPQRFAGELLQRLRSDRGLDVR